MLASILINYTAGLLIDSSHGSRKKLYLTLAVTLNLSILGYFKYAHFITENTNIILSNYGIPAIHLTPISLPVGISFFTFQALSYVIDVYRKQVNAQRNFVNLALYISLFPQLIAGPIVRYNHIAQEITSRNISIPNTANGIKRFLFGLSKKVLLANPLAEIADTIFALPENELTTPLCWLGALCYTLQIYYDFSGYSDMAIGLGRMFGFTFLENFNYPYMSKSIRDFWQRWHISLSSWLRDYVYIPMSGNRGGTYRTYFNLVTVFILCGLWHGASWTFVIWGLYHGCFLILERTPIKLLQQKLWSPLQVVITLLIVIIGWVIFRCETLSQGVTFISIMFGKGDNLTRALTENDFLTNKSITEITIAILLAFPIYPKVCKTVKSTLHNLRPAKQLWLGISVYTTHFLLVSVVTYLSIITLAAGAYNPFIYFRF